MDANQRKVAGVVFLHGSGDSGDGFKNWICSANGAFLTSLLERGFGYRFPSASPIPYTLCGGELMNVWHDRTGLDVNAPEDTEGVLKSIEFIEKSIEELLMEGVPQHSIYLVGLSKFRF